MKVLVFSRADSSKRKDPRFRNVPEGFQTEFCGLDAWEQKHLDEVLRNHDLKRYDRVVLDLKWEFLQPQSARVRTIPGLVIHEFDTWVNYYPSSPDFGRFEQFYYQIPRFRLICTSFRHSRGLLARGLDVRCVPKSFNPETLRNLRGPRPVPYGSIGTRNSRIYRHRNKMLARFRKEIGLEIMTTSSRAEYLERLNQIRIFVSADVGMQEYMAKNFEAMGCGCMLLAYRQGIEEEELGFEDMRNVVLYSTLDEATEKLGHLKRNPAVVEEIAAAGQRLVEERYTTKARDRKLYAALSDPIAMNPRVKKRAYPLLWLRSMPHRLAARAGETLGGKPW